MAFGETWLGWAAALLFFGAFHEYTKSFFSRQRGFIKWGARIFAVVALGVATNLAIGKMEKNVRLRFCTSPNMQISVTRDRILILDNHNGLSSLQDFKINAIHYRLDAKEFANNQTKIAESHAIGGDLDFVHFDVKAGEIKRIDLTKDRYGYTIGLGTQSNQVLGMFDSMVHYVCLRIVFTKEDTGETFVHYVVISPYSTGAGISFTEPESVGTGSRSDQNNFPFSILLAIKADARNYYGTEFREYKP